MPRSISVVIGILPVPLLVASTLLVRADALPETRQHLLDDVKYLASDELEGRGVGTNGLNLAAEFVRAEFAKSGLAVDRVNGGAFQKFDMVSGSRLLEPNSLQLTGPDGVTLNLELGKDVEVGSFGGSGKFDGEVVFCGYGIDATDDPHAAGHPGANSVNYNDFAGVNVEGKVLIVMRRSPRQAESKGQRGAEQAMARFADLRSKMKLAAAYKAAAILFVNDPYAARKAAESRRESLAKANDKVVTQAEEFLAVDGNDGQKLASARNNLTEAVNQTKSLKQAIEKADDDKLMTFGYAGNGDSVLPPAFHIPAKICNQMLASIKTDLSKLEVEIDADLKPQSQVVTGWTAKGVTTIEKVRTDVFNVIGVIDGEGPLADETVIIGAHYDHVGRGEQNSLAPGSHEIHNGADDNASGTATLIELARRFSLRAKEKRPARRLVFIAFTGEELGLIGSARYCKEPVFPLENTIAMFNMDMVGRLKEDKLLVYGTGTSPRWEPELNRFNAESGFKLIFKPEGFGPSDHSSFYAKKIPVLHFFTGEHADYHKPSDDWEKINVEGMARVADFMEKMIVDTVQQTERPTYVEVKTPSTQSRGGSRPYVGTIPSFADEEPGYAISGVAPGGPAEKAGMKGGDRIVKMGPHSIANLDDFDAALRKYSAGDQVELVIIREKKEETIKITLDPPR